MNRLHVPEESFQPAQQGQDVDVAFIGSGPTALAGAALAGAAGLDVAVLERRDGPRSMRQSNSFAIGARLLEQQEPTGVTDEIMRHGTMREGIDLYGNDRTSGVRVRFTDLPTDYPGMLVVPQPHVEGAMRRRLADLGVPVTYNSELTALRQDEDGVTFQTKDPQGRYTEHRAKYVVAADGARSITREKILKLPFEGENFLSSMILADVTVAADQELPDQVVTATGARNKFAFFTPYRSPDHVEGDPNLCRVIVWSKEEEEKALEYKDETGEDAPVDLEVIKSIANTVFGRDLGIREAVWTSRFNAKEALVSNYRGGPGLDRVLLAGDAAHIHSPAGGQGLNLGHGDAFNIVGKIIGVLNGADPSLLDEYTTERRPVAQDVINSSHFILKTAVSPHGIVQRGRVPFLRAALSIPPVLSKIAGQLSGIGIAYPHERGEDKLVGTRMRPNVLSANQRKAAIGKFVLLYRPGTQLDVAGYGDRCTTVPHDGFDALVRPDGHYAWVNRKPGGDDSLEAVLQKLAGNPRR